MSETARWTMEPAYLPSSHSIHPIAHPTSLAHPGSATDSLRPFRSMDEKLRMTQSLAPRSLVDVAALEGHSGVALEGCVQCWA